ncbi:MAG TPA: hypothetical protein VFA36_03565 [Burkholderiales bacterium]|nr:hypothetical protein [Burkholderiales bacterium]
MRDHRGQHAGEIDVEPVFRLARGFRRGIEALGPALAEQGKLARILELHVLRRHLLGRLRGELTVGRFLAALVEHHAFLGAALGRVDLPRFGGCGDQHRARLGARLAHRFPVPAHRGRSAGRLHSEDRICEGLVDAGLLDSHALPVGVQLLCDQHGDRGMHALPHFGQAAHDGDIVVRRDPQIRAHLDVAPGRLREPGSARQREADDQPSSSKRGGLQEVAARSVRATAVHVSCAHGQAPFTVAAASLIAARIWL